MPSATTTYDRDRNVLSVDDSDRSRTACQYDDLGRQTAVSQLDGTITPSTTIDSYGVTHLVYSGTVELTTAYGYDADGNQVTVTDPLSQVTNYQYDHLKNPGTHYWLLTKWA